MATKRIEYIDSLKGVAIFLMVMGRVLSRQYSSWEIALNEHPRNAMLLWRLIYSFHMPLLMFCSGLIMKYIPTRCWKEQWVSLKKRVLVLLLPFFVWLIIKELTQSEIILRTTCSTRQQSVLSKNRLFFL